MGAIYNALEEKINAYEILVTKAEGKEPLRRHKCEDNIIKNLQGMICGGRDRSRLG
jgi:hypothetical protein